MYGFQFSGSRVEVVVDCEGGWLSLFYLDFYSPLLICSELFCATVAHAVGILAFFPPSSSGKKLLLLLHFSAKASSTILPPSYLYAAVIFIKRVVYLFNNTNHISLFSASAPQGGLPHCFALRAKEKEIWLDAPWGALFIFSIPSSCCFLPYFCLTCHFQNTNNQRSNILKGIELLWDQGNLMTFWNCFLMNMLNFLWDTKGHRISKS